MFKNKQQHKEIDFFEQKINETKNDSPCEAAIYSLVRASAKGWLPDNPESCGKVLEDFSNIQNKSVEDIKKQFPKIGLQFNQCINAMAIKHVLDHFEEPSTKEKIEQVTSTIEINIETTQKIIEEQNIMKKLFYRNKIKTNKEIAANLRFFSQVYYNCLLKGSSSRSMVKANVHIDEIKKIAHSMRKK